ncbi:hypothetical protein ACFPN4_06770 [Ureibacillus thermophilus]|uniref:hypothetical protein n=1 Tax=Ureibacillus thermophilus TaxID=367743 RepID=UPI001ABEEC83|nr:hypothetical protein [Ureibacillus thermophilus]
MKVHYEYQQGIMKFQFIPDADNQTSYPINQNSFKNDYREYSAKLRELFAGL